jgi:hypothetical protein
MKLGASAFPFLTVDGARLWRAVTANQCFGAPASATNTARLVPADATTATTTGHDQRRGGFPRQFGSTTASPALAVVWGYSSGPASTELDMQNFPIAHFERRRDSRARTPGATNDIHATLQRISLRSSPTNGGNFYLCDARGHAE